MKVMVTEADIEKVIDSYYESDKKFFNDREALMSAQPAYAALLTDEGYELLSEDEYELCWFVSTVIYTSFTNVNGVQKQVEQKNMEELEENNWTIMEGKPNESFRERLTPFFDNTKQEDLLAFLEDSLESDEDITVSPPGRELIFVAAATLIEALHGA
jgi:hypothetical protein